MSKFFDYEVFFMVKIIVIEDDVLFNRCLKREFSMFKILTFSYKEEFFNSSIEDIQEADYFLLDFNVGKDFNVINSKIYSEIMNKKNKDSILISISDDRNCLQAYTDLYSGKNIDFLKFIIS